MAINKVAVRVHAGQKYVWYHCLGCKRLHGVPSERWSWNGSVEKPTLSPSVKHFMPAGEHGPEKTICHYFVRDGHIDYCGDCEHEMSGKSVEMIEPNAEDVPNNT